MKLQPALDFILLFRAMKKRWPFLEYGDISTKKSALTAPFFSGVAYRPNSETKIMKNFKPFLRSFFLILSAFLAVACGGGSSAPPDTDATAPVITITGDNPASLEQGATYTDAGATAVDAVDGTVAVNATGIVDTATVGSYTITYTATDTASNTATASRTVNVTAPPDTTAPVITIIGDNPASLEQGGTYTDAGATAVDAMDGSVAVNVTNTLDAAVLGTYTVTYTATDAAGNTATASRTVNVLVPAVIMPLNDTGVIYGGSYPTGNSSTCIGETIAQQDCSHGRDAQALAGTLTKIGAGHGGFDFTKLDVTGNPLADQTQSYATQPWSCVRDNHTGLVWEVKNTTPGSIHYRLNTYRWGGKTALLTGEFGTRYDDWDTLVDGSNTSSLCGFTDWRVPSKEEFRSIIKHNWHNPPIDEAYFPNGLTWPEVSSPTYWYATPLASSSDYAWGNHFSDANDLVRLRTQASYVRLVRGRQ